MVESPFSEHKGGKFALLQNNNLLNFRGVTEKKINTNVPRGTYHLFDNEILCSSFYSKTAERLT